MKIRCLVPDDRHVGGRRIGKGGQHLVAEPSWGGEDGGGGGVDGSLLRQDDGPRCGGGSGGATADTEAGVDVSDASR